MEMKVNKKCSCGVIWGSVPLDHVRNGMGLWWNCKCKSTLFTGYSGVIGGESLRKTGGPKVYGLGPHSYGLTVNGKVVGSRSGKVGSQVGE